MNTIIQNILVFITASFALTYIVKKYVWTSKKKKTKSCGGDNSCGCH
ncbi:FeoB-associated Cys-rich membrane protein [Postechiella marina]